MRDHRQESLACAADVGVLVDGRISVDAKLRSCAFLPDAAGEAFKRGAPLVDLGRAVRAWLRERRGVPAARPENGTVAARPRRDALLTRPR